MKVKERLYTDDEICCMYKEAANKTVQIGILCQLNQMRYRDTIKVLIDGGVMEAPPEEKQSKIGIPRGEYHKWTYDDFVYMRKQFDLGRTQKDIAKEYNMTQPNIQNVFRRLKSRYKYQF